MNQSVYPELLLILGEILQFHQRASCSETFMESCPSTGDSLRCEAVTAEVFRFSSITSGQVTLRWRKQINICGVSTCVSGKPSVSDRRARDACKRRMGDGPVPSPPLILKPLRRAFKSGAYMTRLCTHRERPGMMAEGRTARLVLDSALVCST